MMPHDAGEVSTKNDHLWWGDPEDKKAKKMKKKLEKQKCLGV